MYLYSAYCVRCTYLLLLFDSSSTGYVLFDMALTIWAVILLDIAYIAYIACAIYVSFFLNIYFSAWYVRHTVRSAHHLIGGIVVNSTE